MKVQNPPPPPSVPKPTQVAPSTKPNLSSSSSLAQTPSQAQTAFADDTKQAAAQTLVKSQIAPKAGLSRASLSPAAEALSPARPSSAASAPRQAQRAAVPPMSAKKTAAPEPLSQARGGGGIYKVKAGDTLSKIADKHDTTADKLFRLNRDKIRDPNLIYPGQTLRLPGSTQRPSTPPRPSKPTTPPTQTAQPTTKPAPSKPSRPASAGSYTVRSGDTLSSIAARHKTSAGRLFQINRDKISNPNEIHPGQKLRLPGSQAVNEPERPSAPSTPKPSKPSKPSPTRPQKPAPPKRPTPVGNPARMNEAQKYEYYKNVIEKNGGKFHSSPNKRNILALRTVTNTYTNGGNGRYDDKMVMLWKDKHGGKHVRTYSANTEPSRRFAYMGVDANGDGRLDQGRIPAGYYEYIKSYSSRLGNVLQPTRTIMAERDTNQDGRFNDRRKASSGYSMLFHVGGSSYTGSAGCQTFPPGEWNRFWRDVNSSGSPGTIGYTIVHKK